MKGLPSSDIPDREKKRFAEADVHSKLLEADLVSLGFPPRSNTQAQGEYSVEQQKLAVRRLQSDTLRRGHLDILYLIGNSPVVLVEVKRFDVLDNPTEATKAREQLMSYAFSDDFESPPPFLILYSGKDDTTKAFRLNVIDKDAPPDLAYEELPELWTWERIRSQELRGAFQEEVVGPERLMEILTHHLDRLEEALRADVLHAYQLVSSPDADIPRTEFGDRLMSQPEMFGRMSRLFDRKIAEVGTDDVATLGDEVVTQAALNYLNKVFFLNLCEERKVSGFYRILRKFLPDTQSVTSPETVAVFMSLLRRRIKDHKDELWTPEEELVYKNLRNEYGADFKRRVIEQKNWSDLIRVAFDLAEERFPLIYQEDALDDFKPKTDVVAELIFDLSTKSFRSLSNHHVGDIYQGLLASRREGVQGKGGRRKQRSRLGAFYTPRAHVDYMVKQVNLQRGSVVLDPCMGSGHFLDGIYEELRAKYREEGFADNESYRQIVSKQMYGADIDTFATALSAIRLFLIDESDTDVNPRLFVHDMLLYSPERPSANLFDPAAPTQVPEVARGIASHDSKVDDHGEIDAIEFDAIVGNPPYGARKPDYKRPTYSRLYGAREADIKKGSTGTGDGDTYSMFFVNAIERLKEGGRLCLITSDSFRTLTTHEHLRRHILDRCKVVEILVTDTSGFQGVNFKFAGMAITTLEKCSDSDERASHQMRIVDTVADPKLFFSPPANLVSTIAQSDYEQVPGVPFFAGTPADVLESIKQSEFLVGDVASGRVGLQTGDDGFFLKKISELDPADVVASIGDEERATGIPDEKRHYVRFAKGEGFGEYWGLPTFAIDWSKASVAELRTRAAYPAGKSRRAYIRNEGHYFKAGLTYSVISSGRISVRILPEGCIFGHKGSAIFVDDANTDELFLLGYLNSKLATFFMKKVINTTATADVGYIEKLPYRKPDSKTARAVIDRVRRIIDALKLNPDEDISMLQDEIDDLIFELFAIDQSRQTVREFYDSL